MSVFEYIIGVIIVIFALLCILVILLQEGRQANLGVISGAADSFMDKGMARTWDARLAKWTKFIAIAFFVLVFAGMLTTRFLNPAALEGNSTQTSEAAQEAVDDGALDVND